LVKLPVLSGEDVCRVLAKHGFKQVRQKGSHIVMQKQLSDTTITVPVPNHPEIRTGTLLSIIRQSGVTRNDFNI
jgi:predicted RNA binding protein YcfA (HicA-like mRNA interferase family)